MKVFACLFMLLFATPVLADDWHVSRVRGVVTQQVGGTWVPVGRGDTIPNNRYLKTATDGRVGLQRGTETIELEGDTQIRIRDAGPELMTTVLQDFGAVAIEAERRNVQHFSVQTPFLAAVVKGTRFTVTSDKDGAKVKVERGVVQVQDTVHDLVVDIRPGQEAEVTQQAPLLVDGAGNIAVFTFKGIQVNNGTTTEVSAPGKSGDNNAGGNGIGSAVSAAVSNAGGNGKNGSSNAGGNGVGSAVSAAVSNAGGNGKNGSSNAGGNGVGSAVSAVVSNAGGNGNNASSNAGGNGVGSAVSAAVSNAGGNGNNASSNAGGNGVGSAVSEAVNAVSEAVNNAGGNGLAKGRDK